MNFAVLLAAFGFAQNSAFAGPMPADKVVDKIMAEQAAEIAKICYVGNCNVLKNSVIGIVGEKEVKIRHYSGGDFDPNPPKGRYMIASLSKSFTAAMILELAAEGKIDLDQPAKKYLPRYLGSQDAPLPKFQNKEITVRHLLSHTSGLPLIPDEPWGGETDTDYNHKVRQGYTIEQAYQYLKTAKLAWEPGTKFKYSNFGYGILTVIISHFDKMPYEKSLKSRIFDVLGMKNSGIGSRTGKLIPAYGQTGKKIPDRLMTYSGPLFEGSGAITLLPEDYVKYISAQLGFKVPAGAEKLQKAMLATQEMHLLKGKPVNLAEERHNIYPAVQTSDEKFQVPTKWGYYGFGWGGDRDLKRTAHGGTVLGFKSRVIMDRRKDPVAVFVFSNSELDADSDDGVVGQVAKAVINQYVYCSYREQDNCAPGKGSK